MNRVIIGLGSNVDSDRNIKSAKEILAQKFHVLRESAFKTTKPVGNIEQDDFINGAVLIETGLTAKRLKEILGGIESDLGRNSPADHYGPRTIDLDIITWNTDIVDQDFYRRDYLRESVLELIPDIKY